MNISANVREPTRMMIADLELTDLDHSSRYHRRLDSIQDATVSCFKSKCCVQVRNSDDVQVK